MVYQVFIHNYFVPHELDMYYPLVIRKMTKKHFNHTGLLFEENGEWWFVHAQLRVEKVKFEDFLKLKDRSTITIPLKTNLSDEEVIKRANASVGKFYNIKGVFQAAYYILTGKWVGSTESDNYTCFHLVRYCAGDKEAYKALPTLKKVK